MADFNSVPLGRANTGAATVLDNDGKALSIVLAGQRGIEAAKARAEAQRIKAEQEKTKQYTDALNFKLDTGRPFQSVYGDEIAPETIKQLRANTLKISDPMELATANQQVLAQTEKERKMGEQHTLYMDGYTKTALADPERDGEFVANQFLASTKKDGKSVRPSQYDSEVVAQQLNMNPKSYVAPKVAETAFSKILPSSSETFAAGGRPGTFATTDTEKARFFQTEFKDGKYQLIQGADGKPLLNLTPDTLHFLDNGRMKIVLDGKEQEEAAKVAADPKYQPKSRLALLGDLARPFASFDEKQTQNWQSVPRPRAAAGAGKPVAIGFTEAPYAGDVESAAGQYDAKGQPVGYKSTFAAGVGRSLTLKGQPVPITLAANNLTYVGGDGKPNNRYEKVNSDVKVDVSERVYLMTVNGKIVGDEKKNETSADAQARLERLIEEHKNDPHARLKLFYKGTTTDKVNTKGDGVVDGRTIVAYEGRHGREMPIATAERMMRENPKVKFKPIYDDIAAEKQTVYAPASIRGENAIIGHAKANKADYDPQRLNEYEKTVVERAKRLGVQVEDPYHKSVALPAKPAAATKEPVKKYKIGSGAAAKPGTKAAKVPDTRPRLADGTVDYAAEAELKMKPGEAL